MPSTRGQTVGRWVSAACAFLNCSGFETFAVEPNRNVRELKRYMRLLIYTLDHMMGMVMRSSDPVEKLISNLKITEFEIHALAFK